LTEIHIYTDGGSRGNPGPAASAFMSLIITGGKEKVLRKMSRRIGNATNNQAEYRAMIMALEWAISRGFRELVLHSDSELLVKQVMGEYAVRSPRVKDLHGRLMDLLRGVDYSIIHHRRDEYHISICDSLVNSALDGKK
jgi:ribonuclease HI